MMSWIVRRAAAYLLAGVTAAAIAAILAIVIPFAPAPAQRRPTLITAYCHHNDVGWAVPCRDFDAITAWHGDI